MNLKNNISKIRNLLKDTRFGDITRGVAIEAYLMGKYLEESGKEDVTLKDILNRIEDYHNSKEQS